MIEIPFQQLSEDALLGVIEEFIQREGTDYGEVEFSLSEKTAQIKRLLKAEQSILVFDTETESTTIMDRSAFKLLKAQMEASHDDDF